MSSKWNFSCYWSDGYICQIFFPFLVQLNFCGWWTCVRRLFAFAFCSSWIGLHIRAMGMTGVTNKVILYVFIIFFYQNNFEDFPFLLVFCIEIRKGVICSVISSWWIRKRVMFRLVDERTMFRKRVIPFPWIVRVFLHLDLVIVEVLTGLIVCSK